MRARCAATDVDSEEVEGRLPDGRADARIDTLAREKMRLRQEAESRLDIEKLRLRQEAESRLEVEKMRLRQEAEKLEVEKMRFKQEAEVEKQRQATDWKSRR